MSRKVFTSNVIINSKRVRSPQISFPFTFFLLCLCTSTSTVWIVWNTSRKLFCFDVFFLFFFPFFSLFLILLILFIYFFFFANYASFYRMIELSIFFKKKVCKNTNLIKLY